MNRLLLFTFRTPSHYQRPTFVYYGSDRLLLFRPICSIRNDEIGTTTTTTTFTANTTISKVRIRHRQQQQQQLISLQSDRWKNNNNSNTTECRSSRLFERNFPILSHDQYYSYDRNVVSSSSNNSSRIKNQHLLQVSKLPVVSCYYSHQQHKAIISKRLFHTTSYPLQGDNNDNIDKKNISTNHTSINNIEVNGESLYQQYLNIIKQIQQIQQENEKMKSQEMYEAWKRAEEKSSNSSASNTATTKKKNTGVAVVKTLVKHTRKEQQQKQQNEQYEKELHDQSYIVLQKAATQYNHPKSLVLLGNYYFEQAQSSQISENNNSTSRNELLQQALEYYKLSKTAEGLYNIGHAVWSGVPNPDTTGSTSTTTSSSSSWLIEPTPQKAMEYFVQAATEYNDPDAMYFVGVQMMNMNEMMMSSDGSTKANSGANLLQTGLQWIEKAGNDTTLQHGGALYYLALFYLNGNEALGIPPCSGQEFVRRLNTAVASPSVVPDALFLRANCYYYGDNGYPKNYQLAVDDFIRAAQMGQADAAVSAGAILYNGSSPGGGTATGVTANPQLAFEMYQLGGELGNIEGWRNVVSCYATGVGVPQSIEMANYIAKTMLSSNNDDSKDDEHNNGKQ